MRLYAMNQFLWKAFSRNPIIPAPGHMHCLIEKEHTIAQSIAAPEIVKEPTVEPALLAKDPLDLKHSGLLCSGLHERHLIVGMAEGQRTAQPTAPA